MNIIVTHRGANLYISGAWTNEWDGSRLLPGALVIQAISPSTGCSERGKITVEPTAELHELPLEDCHPMTHEQEVETFRRASEASKWVAEALSCGRDAAVLCGAGINRSGLICALVLRRLGTEPDAAIAAVQGARPGALNNESFKALIRRKWNPRTKWGEAGEAAPIDRAAWIASLPIPLPLERPLSGSVHEVYFGVTAYTGLDVFYYLLPEKWQAVMVARRAKQDPITIELPYGSCYKVENGIATRVPRPTMPVGF